MARAALTIPRGEQTLSKQFGTTGYPINTPQWPHRVCVGSAWFDRVGKKPFVKADLFIYSNCVTVSGQCLSMAIIKITWLIFSNPVTYITTCVHAAI